MSHCNCGITMISNEAPVEKDNNSHDLETAQPLAQAAEIPAGVKEVYLEPIEIEEGVFELRDPDGTLVATMYSIVRSSGQDTVIGCPIR